MSVTSPRMSPPPVYDPQTNHYISTTTLKPYLQLPHLLSLTWLAYPILSLLFVAFRLQLSTSSSQDAVASAKGDILTACKAAEQAATAAASMPRYMAIATNQQFADAANGTMNAAREALVLSLTVVEAIINFIVDIYRSTFLCFLELVVRGGLSIIIGAVQEINSFVQSTMSGIRTSIQNDIGTANSAIQSAVSALNKVNPFGNINVPQFNIPSLSALQNVTIPTDFEDALNKLNASLPTVSDLKDKVDALLDTPFELLKKDINDTFLGLSFDPSILPVPQQNTLSFCGDLDTSVVDDLGRDLLKAAQIGTIILILLALLLLGVNCALEWYKWRCQQEHLEYTRQAWLTDPTVYHASASQSAPTMTLTNHNLLMLQADSAHPLLTRIANTIATRFRLTPSQHIHLRWFFHYVFHPPALACFLIGFFGLLSVQLQLIAVNPLEAKFRAQAASSASDFSSSIASSVNSSMYNQSAFYANGVNSHVDTIQNTINNGLFGWVNGTTTTLNNSVNAFYDDIQNAVSAVFNGTILESPAQEFIKCIIGSKVDALEEALTFLNQNLNVQIPRVNDSVLVLSPAAVNEATQPIASAAIGGGSDGNQGLVGEVVNAYVNSLKKERIMFGIFIGLWGFVVLIALCIIFWHSYGREWVEAHRKRRWQRKQRDGLNGMSIGAPIPHMSYIEDGHGHGNADEKGGDIDSQINLRSFTPLPEPKPGLNYHDASDQSLRSLRPYLTISVDNASGVKQEDVTAEQSPIASPVIGPTSHWSTSPSHKRVAPWTLKVTAPPMPKFNPSGPRPQPSRNANVPTDALSTYDDSSLLIPKHPPPTFKSTPLAVPLHHGFERPIPSWTPRSPSVSPFDSPIYETQRPIPMTDNLTVPRHWHRRSSSVPTAAVKYAGHRDGSTQGAILVSTPARQSSNAVSVDPFVTPFDDDNSLTNHHTTLPDNHGQGANTFEPSAI